MRFQPWMHIEVGTWLVQARLVDTHAIRFICHILAGFRIFFLYRLRLTGMVRANEKMKVKDLKMLKI